MSSVSIFTTGLVEVMATSTERMEHISENVLSPEQETGSQGKSELCINMKHNTVLPDNIVTGVTLQIPQQLSRQHDVKVLHYLQ